MRNSNKVFPLILQRSVSAIDHFGPQGVDVDIVAIVKHIGGVASRRPHIDLQGHIIGRAGLKELDMEKSLLDLKGGDSLTARLFKLPGDVFKWVVIEMVRVVDHFHDPWLKVWAVQKTILPSRSVRPSKEKIVPLTKPYSIPNHAPVLATISHRNLLQVAKTPKPASTMSTS